MNYHMVSLNDESISVLIRLLEMAESEISRNFKRLSPEDQDLKDIYWYYKIKGRQIRNLLKEKRGY